MGKCVKNKGRNCQNLLLFQIAISLDVTRLFGAHLVVSPIYMVRRLPGHLVDNQYAKGQHVNRNTYRHTILFR